MLLEPKRLARTHITVISPYSTFWITLARIRAFQLVNTFGTEEHSVIAAPSTLGTLARTP